MGLLHGRATLMALCFGGASVQGSCRTVLIGAPNHLPNNSQAMDSIMFQLHSNIRQVMEGGSEAAVKRNQSRNKLLPRERIGRLIDPGSSFLELSQIWEPSEKGSPSPYGATLRAIVQAAVCMGLYLYLLPHYPLSRFGEPIYQEWGFWKRLSYQYMSGFTARWKYYFIWSISEAAIIISGLGFSGWTESSPPKPRWDRAKNVDILGVEFAKSSV